MMMIVLQNVPKKLHGELTRWMLEPSPGVFIGHVSARVRDFLWEKCKAECKNGSVVQAWNTNHEQHFTMRMDGNVKRSVVDMEGIQLVYIPNNTIPPPGAEVNNEIEAPKNP
ncbi:MAG: type I-E CRISPR-associated endoribonuclease Cas2 [Chloroflexi bacterium]|nr:type I-E CRISPR-associated endoribonuclease Cas2 [Chloroflexota bacterium]